MARPPARSRERREGRTGATFRGETTNAGEGQASPAARDHAQLRQTVRGRDHRPTSRDRTEVTFTNASTLDEDRRADSAGASTPGHAPAS